MNKLQAATLGCKLLAIYALVRACDALTYGLGAVAGEIARSPIFGAPPGRMYEAVSLLAGWLPFALELFMAVVLWFSAGPLVARLLPEPQENEPQWIVETVDIRSAIIFGAGCLVMIQALPDVLSSTMTAFVAPGARTLQATDAANFIAFPSACLRVALALWLLWCGRSASN